MIFEWCSSRDGSWKMIEPRTDRSEAAEWHHVYGWRWLCTCKNVRRCSQPAALETHWFNCTFFSFISLTNSFFMWFGFCVQRETHAQQKDTISDFKRKCHSMCFLLPAVDCCCCTARRQFPFNDPLFSLVVLDFIFDCCWIMDCRVQLELLLLRGSWQRRTQTSVTPDMTLKAHLVGLLKSIDNSSKWSSPANCLSFH